ncbi:M48 family metallopeptidase [Acidobacteria bacterium AH-259-A15]|nr:M48 family metallopeptidase [Acidobacteria bacterium AH-259-A15]
MLGWREIILILIVALVVFYSRSFRIVGVKKSLGIKRTTPEDEIKMGKSLLSDHPTEPETDERIVRILEHLREVGELEFPHYEARRLISTQINAMALFGGYLLTTKGLMELQDASDDELAGILAHEIAHIELGHCREAFIRENRLNVAQALLSVTNRSPGASGEIVKYLAKLGISRESEVEADEFAVELLSKSRYSTVGLIRFLERAKKMEHVPEWLTFLSTHPAIDERIARLRTKLEYELSL